MIAFLPEGEPVVVDPRSLDAMDLILQMPIEWEVMPTFEKLLHRNSVFVDVGAHVGVYSIVAARVVMPHGRIFAIEANPHVFKYLTWTLYSNRLDNNPRVSTINAAAGMNLGTANLCFSTERLGGASLYPSSSTDSSVEVPVVTLDSWIPNDLSVDVMKIDVEGAEPYVLAGSLEIIKRSPRIVIVMELFESSLSGSYGYRKFLDEIRTVYGFKVFLATPGAGLREIPTDEYPGGEHYVMLSRQSLLEIAAAKYCIYGAGLTEGSGPILFYGPYIEVEAGNYSVEVHGEIEGDVEIDITSGYGANHHLHTTLSPGRLKFTLDLPTTVDHFEIVARKGDGRLHVDRIDLTPIRPQPIPTQA